MARRIACGAVAAAALSLMIGQGQAAAQSLPHRVQGDAHSPRSSISAIAWSIAAQAMASPVAAPP